MELLGDGDEGRRKTNLGDAVAVWRRELMRRSSTHERFYTMGDGVRVKEQRTHKSPNIPSRQPVLSHSYPSGRRHLQPAEHVDVPHRRSPEVRREFSPSTAPRSDFSRFFALASAVQDVSRPPAYLADRLRPRRAACGGFVVTGLSALVSSISCNITLLVVPAHRYKHSAPGTALPAGIALLRMLDAEDDSDRPLPPACGLAPSAMISDLGTAPEQAAFFEHYCVTAGSRPLRLAVLPVVITGAQFLAAAPRPPRSRGDARREAVTPRTPGVSMHRRTHFRSQRALSWPARCTSPRLLPLPPLSLLQSSRLGAVETGAAMAPMVVVSALDHPAGGPGPSHHKTQPRRH